MSKDKRAIDRSASKRAGKKTKLPARATFTVTSNAAEETDARAVDRVFDEHAAERVSKKVISLTSDEGEGEGEGGEGEDEDKVVFKAKTDTDMLFDDSTDDEEEENDDEATDDERILPDEYDEEASQEASQDAPKDSKLMINECSTEVTSGTGMKELQERIQEILMRLEKKQFGGKARADLVGELKQCIIQYYDYSEFMLGLLFELFKPSELVDFLEANETPRPVTIRTNTLKCRRRELAAALIARGANVEPLDKWTPVGLQVFEGGTKVPIGATPEYLAGHYMLQAAASFLPVIALNVEEHQKCLDMCAAPGGKSTHIAAQMRNTGFLACNDISEERSVSLTANLHRMGVQNAVVSVMDGRKLQQYYGSNAFDRVLLDAPCSGTGIISKDSSVKGKTADDFKTLGQVQRELLLAAIDMCSPKGVVVYSTCSVTVEENEQVVDYALKKRSVRLVDTGLSFGTAGFTAFRGAQFSKTMSLTRRYYPHTHNLDGFFVAKFEKFA